MKLRKRLVAIGTGVAVTAALIGLSSWPMAHATTTVTVKDDTYVAHDIPKTANGSATTLKHRGTTGSQFESWTYLKFGVASDEIIDGATLTVTYTKVINGSYTVSLYTAPSNWAEGTMTWNTKVTPSATAIASQTGRTTLGTMTWNIPAASVAVGDNTYVLKSSWTKDDVQIASKENVTVASRPVFTVQSHPPTTTTPTTTTTTTLPPPPPGLMDRKELIYSSEIGAWKVDGKPAVDTTTAIPGEATAAGIPMIRFAVYDCFTDMTCGTDNHVGSLSRANFDAAINGIVNNLHAVPFIKMLPITKGALGTVTNGAVFCPPTGNLSMNLPLYEAVAAEVHNVYAGPIAFESSNEAEFDCSAAWGFTGAGAVGVSQTIGNMYAATMPALKKYARDTLGLSDVRVVGYIGVGGGTQWGQTCTVDATKPYGYNCTYGARWIDEFNNAVHTAYVNAGSDPDYVPDAESIHAYPHSTDFDPGPGQTGYDNYAFDDNIAFAFYRNWITQSRAHVDTAWGATIGDQIRFSISEWNAGVSRTTTDHWLGWETPSAVQSFYDGWLHMLQGDGSLTGTGTRYWEASNFEIASNADFVAPSTNWPGKYNLINNDGTTSPQYDTFKAVSLADPLR